MRRRDRDRELVEPLEVFEAKRVLALSSAVLLFNTIFLAVLAPLLPTLASRFHLSKGGAGVLVASYAAGVMLSAIPAGIVVRRLGERATVVAGLSITSSASVAFAFAPTAWALDLARLCQGVGTAASWAGVLAWLLAAAPAERRSATVGTAMGAAVVGSLLGPVLGGAAAFTGRAPTFVPTALVGFALAAWALRLEPPAPSPVEPHASVAGRGGRTLAAGLWLGALTSLNYGVLSVLGPLKLHRLGAGSLLIGATFLTGAAVQTAWNPMLGRVYDRHGRLWPIRGALVAAAAVALAFPVVDERWALGALVVCAGLASSGFWIAGLTLIADAARAAGSGYGTGLTLMNMVWAAGSLLGAGLGGKLAAVAGDATSFRSLTVIFLVTFAATIPWHHSARRARRDRCA